VERFHRYYRLHMIWSERITFDPAVMRGKPCIRGMRVTVGTIVGLFAAGRTEAEILRAYPYLETEDLRAARGALRRKRFRDRESRLHSRGFWRIPGSLNP